MSFGLALLTGGHVAISLAGIGSGLVVAYGFLTAKRLDGWTAVFLATTVATSVTGYFFPVDRFLPSHAVGILSLAVLAVALVARYRRRLAGAWRPTYVVSATVSLYLNVFVLVVQLFQKVPALRDLAPTQSEPPFAVTQITVFAIFVAIAVGGAIRFRDRPATIDFAARTLTPGANAAVHPEVSA
jgi:hypothetical protein